MRKIKLTWFKKYWPLGLILVISILLRIPGLFDPCWYGDEAIYLVMGQGWEKGLGLYRDIFDHKPPVIFILAGLAGNVTNFRTILLFWNLLTLTFIYKLARLFFPKKRWSGSIAAGLFLGLSTFFEGNIANGEIFFVLPNLIASFLVIKQTKKPKPDYWQFLVAGLFYSLAFLIKPPAVTTMAAVIIWYLLKKSRHSFWQRLFSRQILLLILGFGLPVLATWGFYAYHQAGTDFLSAVLATNISYLGSWGTQEHSQTSFLQSLLIQRTLILGVVSLLSLILYRLKKITSTGFLISLWFGLDLWAALLSERPYPHYLIQPVLPLSFLFVNLIYRFESRFKWLALVLISLAVAAYAWIGFWHYSLWAYYKNFAEFALGYKSKTAYLEGFETGLSTTYEAAAYIKARTQADERIFIWGTSPGLYELADRLPIGKYITFFHIQDFDKRDETIQAIKSAQPKYILRMTSESLPFDQLASYLASDYVLVKTIGQYQIYHLLND